MPVGQILSRAQAEVPSARRTDTPTRASWGAGRRASANKREITAGGVRRVRIQGLVKVNTATSNTQTDPDGASTSLEMWRRVVPVRKAATGAHRFCVKLGKGGLAS